MKSIPTLIAENEARAVALTEAAIAKSPPAVTELPMREIALDQAKLAERWKRIAGGLAALLHIGHPATTGHLSFETCTHPNCTEARRLLEEVVDNPDTNR